MKEAKEKASRYTSQLVSLKWEIQKESIENIYLEDLNLEIPVIMSYFHIKSYKMCSYERGTPYLNIQGQKHLNLRCKNKDPTN